MFCNHRKVTVMKRFMLIMVVLAVSLLMFVQSVLATANYVYHEQTNNNPGCGSGAYMSPLAPTAGQAVAIRFKVVDQPNARKVHGSPVPLMGGLAI